MRQHIIDRRLAGKNKSVGNRERFLRRHKEQVREAVKRAIDGRSIRDVERGEDVHIPKKDLSEPVFGHGQGGIREVVHPGNKDFIRGDRIERPKGGGGAGSGKGEASDSGEGEDDFVFSLSKEEFMQVFFEDLALPNLVRTQLAETPEWKSQRAGYSSDGTPNNLHVVRSMRGAIGRRIAIGAGSRAELRQLEEELDELTRSPKNDERLAATSKELETAIAALRARIARIPYLDPIDLRYRSRIRVPVPTSKAVMFCLMDISGSMDEARKDLSKRFFILLYLFLTRHYEKIDLVFIRHHTQAQEVNEDDFFHARETGGTVVSQRAGADGGDHPRALFAQRMEHLRRAGQRRRQLAPRQRPLPRAAQRQAAAAVPLLRLRAGGRGRAEPVGRIRPAAAAARPLRDAQGHRCRNDLPGVPRPVQEGRGQGSMSDARPFRRSSCPLGGPARRAWGAT